MRCNTPLEAAGPTAVPGMVAAPAVQDPTEGSKRIGPGLSAEAKGAPGSSRVQAATVQPPGYGLDAGRGPDSGRGPDGGNGPISGDPDPAPAPAPPAPAEDRRVARRVALVGALLVVAVLVVGGVLLWLTRPTYLDSAAVQRQIADQLTGRLGGPVSVSCPGDQRERAGVTFRCTATDNAGGRRQVTVTVVDNSGNYSWTLGTA